MQSFCGAFSYWPVRILLAFAHNFANDVTSQGLLSLTVEFYRAATVPCTEDPSGNPIPSNLNTFLNNNFTCGLICSIANSPVSPIRLGSTNNIYVIPAPDGLTFGTATILAAACCIPSILLLVSMWVKILEMNWKARFGREDIDELNNATIEGTNGATVEKMKLINSAVKVFFECSRNSHIWCCSAYYPHYWRKKLI